MRNVHHASLARRLLVAGALFSASLGLLTLSFVGTVDAEPQAAPAPTLKSPTPRAANEAPPASHKHPAPHARRFLPTLSFGGY